MKILAIETSCDETACSVVENGRKVLANVIASQIDLHAKTGGVVPEVAAREHVLKMIPVIEECLEVAFGDLDAEELWQNIDAIAVTQGPGLISSLIVGTVTASGIAAIKNLPLIPVQHITGHIYSNWLDEIQDLNSEKDSLEPKIDKRSKTFEEIKFPILVLTVSGGHNELILMRDHHDFEVLGETLDDAAGEAFDKVARLLGLGYPGGPVISQIAEKGDPTAFDLPRAWMGKDNPNFSFSGLKTAVLLEVKNFLKENKISKFKADLAASFQEAVVEVLAEKLIRAYRKYPEVSEIHLAGGVSANKRLREVIEKKVEKLNLEIENNAEKMVGKSVTSENVKNSKTLKFRYPKNLQYCTDNAAMIAASAYFLYQKLPEKFRNLRNITPKSSLSF